MWPVNFVEFRVLGKNYQLISQKLHFPRPNSVEKSQRIHFLSVSTERVCRPLATVRVVPLYLMCRRVEKLCDSRLGLPKMPV